MKFKNGDIVMVDDGDERWKGIIDSAPFKDRCFIKDTNPDSEFYGDIFSRNIKSLSLWK